MKHLSKTQIGMYRRCPYQYFCRYVEGLKLPPTSSLFMGRCFDDAINFNYQHKIDKGKDEKVSVVKDYFNDTFKSGQDNVVFESDEKPAKLKDSGILTTEEFHRTICRKTEPAQIQIEDGIMFDNVDYELRVVIDLVTKDNVVVDNKYTSKTWAQGKEYGELDPVIYTMWNDIRTGKTNSVFRFDIGIATKKPKTEQRDVYITQENKQGFLKYLAVVNDCIKQDSERGLFLPRTDNFLCSRRKCGYWQKCELEWKHRIKD